MKRLLASIATVFAATLVGAPAVHASCGVPVRPGGQQTIQGWLDTAPLVFVGTVVGTTNNNRVARVQVESVWKGEVPSTVTVAGTPELGSAATSVDRTFNVGQRYLFVPSSGSSPFQDNSCSATQPYSSQLDGFKPATAHPPTAGSDGLDPTGLAFAPGWVWPAIPLLAIVGGVAAWLLIRRARRMRLLPGSQA